MGLLALGTPLDWADAAKLAAYVREHGITQFLHTWRETRGRCGDRLLWGDELEYMVVVLDHAHKTARLSLRQTEVLDELQKSEHALLQELPAPLRPTFHPEYGRYMIESTPGTPFGVNASELLRVERDMHLRRRLARAHLRANEVPMTLTSFPRLGVRDAPFTEPAFTAQGDASRSLFLPDELINTHVRFPTLTANIRKRRGSKVCMNVPIYRDAHTPAPFVDPSIPWDRALFPEDAEARLGAARDDHIYMDAMGFGMGCCCLQVTFQACALAEARCVYDQLIPFTPLMIAVTAASPAYRGYLADVDCRWDVISGAVDDRTPAERGVPPLKPGEPEHASETTRRRLHKSRYDSVDSYLFTEESDAARMNDLPLAMDDAVLRRLRAEGVDPLLAEHMAHLFVRDPLVIFSERVHLDDATSTDHFENIQSTNWQTMRFKPPPPGGQIGWRVEFRPMEVQLTDFENAAFSVFIVLLTRVILSYNLNFYMPLSLVDTNMQRAQQRDAIHTQRFFFRRDPSDRSQRSSPGSSLPGTPTRTVPPDARAARGHAAAGCVDEYTLAELFDGKHGDNPGLLSLIHQYLDALQLDVSTRCRLNRYIDFVGARARGEYITTATWMRHFIRTHPAYKHDSVVSEEITYDMLCRMDKIEQGIVEAPGFLPPWYAQHVREEDRDLERK
ncbi:glutamate--cysteine ligase [Malassezia sp. CBS 17886]|nr:glutamate--cysteine ligase [Malassezia sp. CBS 17886]